MANANFRGQVADKARQIEQLRRDLVAKPTVISSAPSGLPLNFMSNMERRNWMEAQWGI